MEELNKTIKLKVKKLAKKIKNLPKKIPFGFKDYLEKQREQNEIDLCLFLEPHEERKIVYDQIPKKRANRRYGIFEKWLYYEWCFY